MKVCTRCLRGLPADSFGKDSSKGCGLRSACKSCLASTRNKENEKAYYLANRGALIARGKTYYLTHKEQVKKHAISSFKRSVDAMDDKYIRHTIIKGTSLKRHQVPQGLVDLKRVHLAVKRQIKRVSNEKC